MRIYVSHGYHRLIILFENKEKVGKEQIQKEVKVGIGKNGHNKPKGSKILIGAFIGISLCYFAYSFFKDFKELSGVIFNIINLFLK